MSRTGDQLSPETDDQRGNESTTISVVIPLFNKSKYVLRAVASAISQTVPAKEIIVVDDGSTDGSAELVAEWFPTAKLLRQQNQGPGSARNHGIAEASSDWIAFLDADDFWAPWHLADLQRCIRLGEGLGLVATGYVQWSEGRPVPTLRTEGSPRRVSYFDRAGRDKGFVCASSAGASRRALIDVGGFSDHSSGEDLVCWARLALHYEVAHTPSQSAVYVRGVGGVVETQLLDKSLSVTGFGDPGDLAESSPSFRVVDEWWREGGCADSELRGFLDDRLLGAIHSSLARGNIAQARYWRRDIASWWKRNLHLISLLAIAPASASQVLWRLRHSKPSVRGY